MLTGDKAAKNEHASDVLERYIDPGFVYDFTKGPDVIQSREQALQSGINCISLAHLALRDLFDRQLPPELGCAEMYSDRDHFTQVGSVTDMRLGDLVWFGVTDPIVSTDAFVPRYNDEGQLTNWRDFPVKHVAVYTGKTNEADDYLLLHSSFLEGNVVWPMSRFADYRRYRKLYGVSRLLDTKICE